jgi:hypothetical protein
MQQRRMPLRRGETGVDIAALPALLLKNLPGFASVYSRSLRP